MSDRSRARPARAGRRQRARESLWLFGPILGGGCLSGIALIVLGVTANRRSWWISGLVYMAIAWSGFIIVGEADLDTPASDWGTGIWLVGWLATILHGVLINDAWLKWRATTSPEKKPRGLKPPPRPPRPHTSRAGASAPGADPSGDGTSAPLELNSATAAQLAGLPGITTRVARRIVKERESRGGYLAVADIVDVARLAPHEYARLRDQLTCVPRELPDQPTPGSIGRIVDV